MNRLFPRPKYIIHLQSRILDSHCYMWQAFCHLSPYTEIRVFLPYGSGPEFLFFLSGPLSDPYDADRFFPGISVFT